MCRKITSDWQPIFSKVAPTCASNLCKLVCTNCLKTATDGTSMWRKPSGCSSYGVQYPDRVLSRQPTGGQYPDRVLSRQPTGG